MGVTVVAMTKEAHQPTRYYLVLSHSKSGHFVGAPALYLGPSILGALIG